MRRALALLALAPALLSAQPRVVVKLRAYRDAVALDTLARSYTVPASNRAVYLAAIEAFDELGIAVNVKDEKRGIVAATRFVRMRTLGGQPMSAYFECGTGMTGPHANEWRLEMAVAALIDVAPQDETRLSLASVASGQDVEGSKDPIGCHPTGSLEQRLLETIQKLIPR